MSILPRARRLARHALDDAGYALALRALPPRVAALQLRCRLSARRHGDLFSLTSATRPPDLARLLRLAHARRNVVELGTGTAWTTLALAAADARRSVVSFDPVARPERERYLALAGAGVRRRIDLIEAAGAAGPRDRRPVELLYVDSSHECEPTIAELRAWLPVLAPGGLVVFDDYGHPAYPGIAEAVAALELAGWREGTLFVHRRPGAGARPSAPGARREP